MALVSILLNTIDRWDLTVQCIGTALATAGYPFELLVCDNGSTDQRVIDFILRLKPAYFRQNATNEGCAQMHNQMLLRAKGDYFCLLDNDIAMPPGWLAALVEAYERVSNSGVIGIHSLMELHDQRILRAAELILREGDNAPCYVIRPAMPPKEDAIFGNRMFGCEVLEKVGYFSEEFGVYGLVDNHYNSRVYASGFINYYIDSHLGQHLGDDVGEASEYRAMKWRSLEAAKGTFVADIARRYAERDFYIPPPAMR